MVEHQQPVALRLHSFSSVGQVERAPRLRESQTPAGHKPIPVRGTYNTRAVVLLLYVGFSRGRMVFWWHKGGEGGKGMPVTLYCHGSHATPPVVMLYAIICMQGLTNRHNARTVLICRVW